MQVEALKPNQSANYARLTLALDKFPSATLLSGNEYSGVLGIADNLVASLLCQDRCQKNNTACARCQACELLLNDTNPDLFNFATELALTEGKFITIELVRKMIDFAALAPNFAQFKVVYLPDMARLNLSSANSLLKIIEEPPSYLKFIFVSYNLRSILPTILSRCSRFIVKPQVVDLATADTTKEFWHSYNHQLDITNVLTDKQLYLIIATLSKPSVDNIFECSAVFNGKEVSFLVALEFIYKWLTDLLSYVNGGNLKIFSHYQSEIDILAKRIRVDRAFYLSDSITFLIKWANHPVNYKLQLENILLKYQQLFRVKGS